MRNFLVLFVVLLSGCISMEERTDEVTQISVQKRQIGTIIIERMEQRVEELCEEQTSLIMVIEQIKANLKKDSEWIRSGREVDPKEICKF